MSVASDLPKCAGRGSCAEEKLCGRGHACEHEQGPLFDTKFGADFLAGVPTEPGVYRFYDVEGALLYVGKATSLRGRLGQYRTAGRKKKERKRRALVNAAARIEWDVCDSALAAALRA